MDKNVGYGIQRYIVGKCHGFISYYWKIMAFFYYFNFSIGGFVLQYWWGEYSTLISREIAYKTGEL